MDVKLLAEDGELYILANSRPRALKARGMRRRRLKKLWRRLTLPRHTQPTREHQLLLDQLKLRLPEQPPRISA